MRRYRFDEAVGRRVSLHGSRFAETALTGPEGGARAACLHLPPGGLVGRTRPRPASSCAWSPAKAG